MNLTVLIEFVCGQFGLIILGQVRRAVSCSNARQFASVPKDNMLSDDRLQRALLIGMTALE